MEEIWVDVKGYEGLYQVSNMGRCKSLDRVIQCDTLLGNVNSYVHKGKVLSCKRFSHKDGYSKVRLVKDHIYKQHYLHKIVAEAFLPNPDNKQFVDHIDTNKQNNRVDNLRWVTHTENVNNPLTKRHASTTRANNSSYIVYCFKGESALSLCKKVGIKPTTFYRRVNNLNWSIEDAIFTPVKTYKKQN